MVGGGVGTEGFSAGFMFPGLVGGHLGYPFSRLFGKEGDISAFRLDPGALSYMRQALKQERRGKNSLLSFLIMQRFC